MNYYEINNKDYRVSFKQAVLQGIGIKGGLFVPETIPTMPKEFFHTAKLPNYKEMAFTILSKFIEDEINENDLWGIIDNVFNFNTTVVKIANNIFVTELFNGPTLAFKDYGARFTAAVTEYFNLLENKKIFILVATSGDTGSAVAQAFYNKQGVDVVVLYPKGKISELQEKQITTLGGNIKALEVEGTFDDCQSLVKKAFNDKTITNYIKLSSANSINIARLLPQTIYYFYSYFSLNVSDLVFVVPSGNLGNLTAGLIANKMGIPVNKFIAAVNENKVIEAYMKTGIYEPQKSIQTLANAMDVGNPSNFARIMEMYNNNYNTVKEKINSASVSDNEILSAIKFVYENYNYILDPHGAVGYKAVEKLGLIEKNNYILLETAHPIKFYDTVESVINKKIIVPERLKESLNKEKNTTTIDNNYNTFKEYLLSLVEGN